MLTRSVERPRTRGVLYMLAGGALVAGAFVLFDRDDVAPITKVEVAPPAPAAAPVVVPIHVQQPTPMPEPAPVAVAPEPEPRVRALKPHLHAECVDMYDAEPIAACTWEDGFPAITHDGKTVVVKRYIDDGGRGYPNLHIDFIDVASSNVQRSVKILDSDEFDPDETRKHRAKVQRRVAAVQRTLDAGNYRSFVRLVTEDSGEHSWTHLRAEIDGGSIRIVDPESGVAIWRKTYSGKTEFPKLISSEEDMCGEAAPHEAQAWWDDESRTVITTASFTTGGCMCPTLFKTDVTRVQ